jgi:hypothetical protein
MDIDTDEDPILKKRKGSSQGGGARAGGAAADGRAAPVDKASSSWVDIAFDDKRVTIACISVWFFICLGGFGWLGIFSSEYMRIGPSATLTYMGMVIDTMPRYIAVVVFVVLSTAINDFASDAIGPWIQNTVMDHKSQTIPYSKFTIVFIAQSWSLYCGVMTVASIALVFAQFDLIIYRLIVDLFVNQYTMRRFLTNKTHDPFRYHTEFLNDEEMQPIGVVTEGLSVLNEKDRNSRGSVPFDTLPYERKPAIAGESAALANAIMRTSESADYSLEHDLEYNDSRDMSSHCNDTVTGLNTAAGFKPSGSSKKKSGRQP